MGNPMYPKWARLYLNPTVPELALEPAVAALGLPYRVQHPMPTLGWCILDFAVFPDGLAKPGIVLEVDGASHDTPSQKLKDIERTAKLRRAGWKVARCKNAAALSNPAATVAKMMKEAE